jgi:predicted DNA-binding antitoxin AbrB/MazE fold protein
MVIRAIHENGVLRLLTPLNLPEQIEVEIAGEIRPIYAFNDGDELFTTLLRTAELLAIPDEISEELMPLSEEEERALAARIKPRKPFADIIIEERGEAF